MWFLRSRDMASTERKLWTLAPHCATVHSQLSWQTVQTAQSEQELQQEQAHTRQLWCEIWSKYWQTFCTICSHAHALESYNTCYESLQFHKHKLWLASSNVFASCANPTSAAQRGWLSTLPVTKGSPLPSPTLFKRSLEATKIPAYSGTSGIYKPYDKWPDGVTIDFWKQGKGLSCMGCHMSWHTAPLRIPCDQRDMDCGNRGGTQKELKYAHLNTSQLCSCSNRNTKGNGARSGALLPRSWADESLLSQ